MKTASLLFLWRGFWNYRNYVFLHRFFPSHKYHCK
jgi:hypothetical protein